MSGQEISEVQVRRVARVILLDPQDRVLLLAARNPAGGKIVWFVPGGGVEADESLEQAAFRELAEEVPAAAGVVLRGPISTRHHDYSWAGHGVSPTEWFFVGRLDGARRQEDGRGRADCRTHCRAHLGGGEARLTSAVARAVVLALALVACAGTRDGALAVRP